MDPNTQDTTAERISAALFGLACGDALGAPAEFMPPEKVKVRWGVLKDMVGGSQWTPGEWTDDTGMALAVAEGILENPDDPVEATGEHFLAWLETAKDVGSTVSAAIDKFHKYKDWAVASQHTPQAKQGMAGGNGSLMRTLPIALAYPDREEMLCVSARLSAMTHWDSQAQTCCAIYCLWVRKLLNGAGRREAWFSALDEGRKLVERERLAPDTAGMLGLPPGFWQRLDKFETKTYDELQPSGFAGYVVDCLEAAVWAVLNSDSLEEALVRLVNLGGETDTMAAVAGGAAGAYWGMEAIPARWLERLHERERIERVADELVVLRRHRELYATRDLPPFNFSEIDDRIVAGRNPLTSRDVRFLHDRLGVTRFLDLREPIEWTAPRFGGDALMEMERLGLERVNIPVRDVSPPAEAQLDRAYKYIAETLKQPGARIYIHCRAGNERTGAILTAYYGRERGDSFSRALAFLRERRRSIWPTPGQERAVRAWLKKR